MSFVVACSVAARWFLADEATPYTEAVFDLLPTPPALAPSLLRAEFAVYLELALRRGHPLACCDGGLRQAATRAGVFLEMG